MAVSENIFPALEYNRFRCELLGISLHRKQLVVHRIGVAVEV